ncbi:MAG: chemotaxis protein CheW [Burkholderiaceae bacterium]|nr:chemotaxis protein CheW [Burkholderiaceae bacterium]
MVEEKESVQAEAKRTEVPREYLAFNLGQEEYGIDILRVQEIRGYEEGTQLANAPAFLKGFLNWRDIIIPIIDMRIRMNLGEATYDNLTVVIVLSVANRIVGIVVDSVSDVMRLQPDQIKPAPTMGSMVDTRYLFGLATLENRLLILMDIDKWMSSPEMGLSEIDEYR